MTARWAVEQVVALASGPTAVAAAETLADRTKWSATGADDRSLWGRCRGTAGEPYDVAVDHVDVRARCSCPSRRSPCKHSLALLLLWTRGEVPDGSAPPVVATWVERAARASVPAHDRRGDRPTGTGPDADARPAPSGRGGDGADTGPVPTPMPPPGQGRDERVARMRAGLVELDRWLEDRLRTGLADPALARYETWDELAARLVDARAGALANRVRRLAGLVGVGPDWHGRVLAEVGILHLVVRAGLRLRDLPDGLADTVATAAGWQVRRADVLAGVPETDEWVVAGRSDVREDRIEVRRTWLWGRRTRQWAMVLSFAAYRQSLDESLAVGTAVSTDLFRYPGGSLRALVAPATTLPERDAVPDAVDVATACDLIGEIVAAEPWIERVPVTVLAAPTVSSGRWVVSDTTGSLPLLLDDRVLAVLLGASAGRPVPITLEWTPDGMLPLTVHLVDHAIDVGPRADPSFVSGGAG